MATIRERRLFRSALAQVRLLFEREASIRSYTVSVLSLTTRIFWFRNVIEVLDSPNVVKADSDTDSKCICTCTCILLVLGNVAATKLDKNLRVCLY